MWMKFFYIILVLFSLWQLFIYLRFNPYTLSRDKVNRGLYTMGLVSLTLIAFVILLVKFVIIHA